MVPVINCSLTNTTQPGPSPASGQDSPGLYLHIPFCKSRCAYCAFNSRACKSPPSAYLKALASQIRFWAGHDWCRKRHFASLFIGGGTPTIYPASDIASLVSLCLSSFRFSRDCEITVEANPNTTSARSLAELRRAGINRLSLGVQAFSGRLLDILGRSHSPAQAKAAVSWARKAGFANLNLDLMYGLPGQSLTDWRESLEIALDSGPEHLACYELTIEDGTPFARRVEEGELLLPDEDEALAMAELAGKLAGRSGLKRYEISNYAAFGRRCRHNLNYWHNGDYLGLGAGAVSCLSGFRFSQVADSGQFTRLVERELLPLREGECLPLAARFRESVIMGMRLTGGVSLARLKRRFALAPAEYYGETLDELLAQGLVAMSRKHLRLTRTGLALANQILARLV